MNWQMDAVDPGWHWHCVKCGDTYRVHQDEDLKEIRACNFCSGKTVAMTLERGAKHEQSVALGRPCAWGHK
jgi:DNA-directed RNA polymerase subunit RPC12/RpoP